MRTNKKILAALDVLFLCLLFWLVRYWFSREFGLYEDDFTFLPTSFRLSAQEFWVFLTQVAIRTQTQGRPFHKPFIYLFSWIGWRIGGMWGCYLVGFLITAVNIGLFYAFMRRVSCRELALLSGLFYVLYSADTTQSFLTHSLGVQPAILFILLALHAYLSNKAVFAYLLALCGLLSYETTFLVFLGAPLFNRPWNRKLIRRLVLHMAILVSMVALDFLIRRFLTGEGRAANLSLVQMAQTSVLHMIQGPAVSAGTYLYRPYLFLKNLSPDLIAMVLPAGAALTLILLSLRPGVSMQREAGPGEALFGRISRLAFIRENTDTIKLGLAGFIMLVFAYPLTQTVRAYAISGRDTRVHLAGVIGASILLASLTWLILKRVWKMRLLAGVSIAGGVCILSMLVGYGFLVQRDYVQAWTYQREFWTQLLPLIPDADEDTVILVSPEGIQDTLQMGANTWALSNVIKGLYEPPPEGYPQVFRLRQGWQVNLAASGSFPINAVTCFVPPELSKRVDLSHIILIDTRGGSMTRVAGPIQVGEVSLALKPFTESHLALGEQGILYDLMILPPGQAGADQ